MCRENAHSKLILRLLVQFCKHLVLRTRIWRRSVWQRHILIVTILVLVLWKRLGSSGRLDLPPLARRLYIACRVTRCQRRFL